MTIKWFGIIRIITSGNRRFRRHWNDHGPYFTRLPSRRRHRNPGRGSVDDVFGSGGPTGFKSYGIELIAAVDSGKINGDLQRDGGKVAEAIINKCLRNAGWSAESAQATQKNRNHQKIYWRRKRSRRPISITVKKYPNRFMSRWSKRNPLIWPWWTQNDLKDINTRKTSWLLKILRRWRLSFIESKSEKGISIHKNPGCISMKMALLLL